MIELVTKQPSNSTDGNYFISNVKYALQIISKKWVIDILMVLTGDSLRFSEIEKYIPQISSKMLSERLTELQDYDLITKQVKELTPLNIQYTVSPRGLKILRSLAGISKIGSELRDSTRE